MENLNLILWLNLLKHILNCYHTDRRYSVWCDSSSHISLSALPLPQQRISNSSRVFKDFKDDFYCESLKQNSAAAAANKNVIFIIICDVVRGTTTTRQTVSPLLHCISVPAISFAHCLIYTFSFFLFFISICKYDIRKVCCLIFVYKLPISNMCYPKNIYMDVCECVCKCEGGCGYGNVCTMCFENEEELKYHTAGYSEYPLFLSFIHSLSVHPLRTLISVIYWL